MANMTKDNERLLAALEAQGVDDHVAGSLARFAAGICGTSPDYTALAREALGAWRLAVATASAKLQASEWAPWPSTEAWEQRSRSALLDCRPIQWRALTMLWAQEEHFHGHVEPPPHPDDLQHEHFIGWDALVECLRQLRDYDLGEGEPQVLPFLTPQYRVEFLVVFPTADGASHPQLPVKTATLLMVRNLAAEVARRTGLRLEQAVPFLLCNAPMTIDRVALSVAEEGYDLGGSRPPLLIRLAGPDVTVNEVRHAYRSFQDYLQSLGNRDEATTSGYAAYLSDNPPEPAIQPSDRTLQATGHQLVKYVETRRKKSMSWQQIFDEWNADHPDREAKTLQSLQSNYYQARRRLKKPLQSTSHPDAQQSLPEPGHKQSLMQRKLKTSSEEDDE